MAVNLVANFNGLPRPDASGTYVQMTWPHKSLIATEPLSPESTIWTDAMSACCAIATYDHATHHRTLIHLPGGTTSDEYFTDTARLLSPGSTVIIAAGSEESEWALGMFKDGTVIPGFEAAMLRVGKHLLPNTHQYLNYRTYWANKLPSNKISSSFALQANGEYGSVHPPQQGAPAPGAIHNPLAHVISTIATPVGQALASSMLSAGPPQK